MKYVSCQMPQQLADQSSNGKQLIPSRGTTTNKKRAWNYPEELKWKANTRNEGILHVTTAHFPSTGTDINIYLHIFTYIYATKNTINMKGRGKRGKKKREREAVRRIKYNPVKISASAERKKTEEKSHK